MSELQVHWLMSVTIFSSAGSKWMINDCGKDVEEGSRSAVFADAKEEGTIGEFATRPSFEPFLSLAYRDSRCTCTSSLTEILSPKWHQFVPGGVPIKARLTRKSPTPNELHHNDVLRRPGHRNLP
jgi:hypothetical protein